MLVSPVFDLVSFIYSRLLLAKYVIRNPEDDGLPDESCRPRSLCFGRFFAVEHVDPRHGNVT